MTLVPVTLEQAELAQAAREEYKPLSTSSERRVISWAAYEHFLKVTEGCWTMTGRMAHYWQTCRVMVGALQWTGARIVELDDFRRSMIFGNVIYWEIGKNQEGLRKEYLPDEYLRELQLYRDRNRVAEDKLFGVSASTFSRYFDKYVRPFLGQYWNEKKVVVKHNLLKLQYIAQLKYLRKNMQTILFKKFFDEFHDAGIALEFVAKRLNYSSTHISAHYYIQDFAALDIDAWMRYWALVKISAVHQARLLDFG